MEDVLGQQNFMHNDHKSLRKTFEKSILENLDSERMVWTLALWMLWFWTPGRLDSGLLDSRSLDPGRLDAWSLDACTQGDWTLDTWALNACILDNWTLGFWMVGRSTLGPRKFYQFLVTSIFFLLLFTVEFLSISKALWLMCYGSVEIAMNICYNSNLLQLIF